MSCEFSVVFVLDISPLLDLQFINIFSWQPTPVFLPGKSHGRRSLGGYSPWDHKESNMTEQLHFDFLSLSVMYLVVHTVKHLPTMRETQVQSLGWEDLLEKEMATHSSLPGKSHGWRSLVGYSSWGHKELDMTEQFHFLSFLSFLFRWVTCSIF